MTQYNWSSNGGGSWGTAADWGPNGLPTQFDTVNIAVPGVTVTVGTGVAASAYSLSTSNASLLVSGGTLYTVHLATFNGGYTQTSGTYTAGGMGAIFNGPMNFTGGTIDVLTGALKINDGASLSGTLSGAGVLEFGSGASYINTGFVCNLKSIVLDYGARVGFNTNFTFAHNLSAQNGVLDLFGHTLGIAATGNMLFSGVVGDGVVKDAGTLTVGTTQYSTVLDNGLVVDVTGTMIQTSTLSLGTYDAGAKIVVGKTGHYEINGNWNIYDPSSVGSITNAGVFAKTGGAKLARIDSSLTSSGTLQTGIGEMELNGLVNAVSGTVSGGGTLGVGGGRTTLGPHVALEMAVLDQHSGILVVNGPQTCATEWDMLGGVLNLNAAAAVLTLTGRDSFDGGVITGYGGTLVLNGTAEMSNVTLGGPDKINVNGTVDQTGTVYLGTSSNPVVTIAATASWLDEGDSSILGTYGLIRNLGLFSDPNGSGDAVVQSELSSSGTVNVNNSTLTLAGTNLLTGTLSGSGLLDLAGDTTLRPGLSIKVAALDISGTTTLAASLSDAGLFSEYGNGLIDTGGLNLALTGTVSLDSGSLTDGGTLSTAGQTTIGNYTLTGGAELLVSGSADQIGQLSLSGPAGGGILVIAQGATYNILDDFDIASVGAVGVSGSLVEDGTGVANIDSAVTLAKTGSLISNDQTLSLTDGGSLAGTLAGSGRINFGGGFFTLLPGLSMVSAGLEVSGNATVQLQTNELYGGDFLTSGAATLALGGDTLSLTGSTVLGYGASISGPGLLLTSGNVAVNSIVISGGSTLTVNGAAEQALNVQLGDSNAATSTAALNVGAGGTYVLDANASIFGNGTLSVAGSLSANGAGSSQIASSIVDTGVISANLGTLQVQGSVTGTGVFSIGAGTMLDFSSSASIGSATDIAFGSPAGDILRIDDLKTFGATIENFANTDMIQITGLYAGSLTGTYANSAHTQILVSDGSGSITLNFATAQSLTSISFTANANGIATLIHH